MKYDVKEIKTAFKKVITYSQGIENPEVDKLFLDWEEAKRNFIQMFGDDLRFTTPTKIAFELNEDEKRARLNRFISEIDDSWGNTELADFVETMSDGFFANSMPYDYKSPDGTIIKKGTKIIRAFKYFEFDKIALEVLQNEASLILQENKIEGYLTFSVHPLDFLSLSENDYNWRSCHALNGDYRSGNLSYMLDTSTFIAYLHTGDKRLLPGFPVDCPWYSKKWRMLLFMSNDETMMFAGRPYPFVSQNGAKHILNLFNSIYGVNNSFYFGDWQHDFVNSVNFNGKQVELERKHIVLGGSIKPLSEIIVDAKIDDIYNDNYNTLHYNDLLHSSVYSPIYSYRLSRFDDRFSLNDYYRAVGWSNSDTKFYIGGIPLCLRCGEHYLHHSSSMQCDDCGEKYGENTYDTCDCCGQAVGNSEGTWVDDFYLCDRCIEKEVVRCYKCGVSFFKRTGKYSRENAQFICACCMED